MELDNVAVIWPRARRRYDPVAPSEFVDFGELATRIQADAASASVLAERISSTSAAQVGRYTELVDLLLGLNGVLYATEASSEDEDPVIDPDGCAWVAGGLERFVTGHLPLGRTVTFDSVSTVLRTALEGSRLARQQLAWLESRLNTLRDQYGTPPQWDFSLAEIGVLAKFYRRCADRGFAVFADF